MWEIMGIIVLVVTFLIIFGVVLNLLKEAYLRIDVIDKRISKVYNYSRDQFNKKVEELKLKGYNFTFFSEYMVIYCYKNHPYEVICKFDAWEFRKADVKDIKKAIAFAEKMAPGTSIKLEVNE